MRAAVLTSLCLLGFVPCSATTLVALWTPDRIVLGADSMVVTEGPAAFDACKIVNADGTWLAVSGLVTDSTAGFELGPLARLALGASGTMKEKLTRFADSVQTPLQRAYDGLRRDSPVEHARFASGRPVLQAIFAGQENGRPVLATVAFVPGTGGSLELRASLVDGSDARGPRLIYAGQQDRIREYLKAHREWFAADRQEIVRSLVQLEVDGGPGLVGGPIDIVEIDAAGTHWVQRKSGCQE
jgi:hypothetical protein